jgi:hypothetical protein
MDVDQGMRERIRELAEQRLARPLTSAEWANICKPRSLIGLEAIIDWLEEKPRPRPELVEYLRGL